MPVNQNYRQGDIVLTDLNPTIGREINKVRPAVIVSSTDYNITVGKLLWVIPITSTNRGWSQYVKIQGSYTGLEVDSFATTEQMRTISIERVIKKLGTVDSDTLQSVKYWIHFYIN